MPTNTKAKAVSIVIPALNEALNLKILVSKIDQYLKSNIYEIIIIDDNSNDGSREILLKLKKKNSNLRFYIRNKERDLNQSCQLGFQKSRFSSIVVMDADLQHDPKYLPSMINLFFLKNNDFLIATRNFSKEIIRQPRFIFSLMLVMIINLLFGYRTTDPMSGFFIFKKSIYLRNKKKLYGLGFKILFDLLYVNKNFLLIKEFKFKFNKRKYHKSKMNFKILYILVKMIMYYFIKKILSFNITFDYKIFNMNKLI
jgi:dolichol-phosphate mannosyltransferase